MPNIKMLTTHLQSLTDLSLLLPIFVNLEELKFSIDTFDDITEMDNFKIPISLIKLHLQIENLEGYIYQSIKLQTIKNFLFFFRNQLHFLTLIVKNNNDKYFADFNQLENLKNSFSHLSTFQYFIHTIHKPSGGFHHVEKLFGDMYNIYTKDENNQPPV
ncbi:unnamed protein product, partial [Rotaria sp. Silwood2]